jgi:ATP-binding cassette subfamily F protein uup
MALLSFRNISLAFGGPPLLEGVTLQVRKGERICLLGRNGAGKSSLLGLIAGALQPDAGVIDRQQGLRVAWLPQEVPQGMTGTVFEAVAQGVGALGERLCRYHELSRGVEQGNEGLLPEFMDVQHTIDSEGGWPLQQRIEQILSRLKLEADAPVARLSGGLVRRVLLARTLATDADILLLDEPTNHLDIELIGWLEEFLLRESLTLIFVTHDRAFLRTVATRIVELDGGHLFDFACDYDSFLQRKEDVLHAEELERSRFDKKLSKEEAWIRQGIKARRTRNQGRVRALKKMREQRRQRRERQGTARLRLHEAEKSGKLVVDVENVDFVYDGGPVISAFSTTVLRGDRVGIIGPNGSGKTTLLKLLIGELAPQQGSVRFGTNLQVLYFDQLREQLDPDKTVQKNVSGEQDTVIVGGRSRHVIGYLQDFLFTPERARTPVRILSGGERNRLLLAKLFTREANVLVLDEPTNDLDLETLDLLEELLAEFQGTIFLVSHDRAFLNRVVTSTIAFEGGGRFAEYVGGYDDWLRQRQPVKEPAAAPRTPREKPAKERPRKLSFKERRELEELPQRIEALETDQAELYKRMAEPAFYRQTGEQISEARVRLEAVEAELEKIYARWEELEKLDG